ncbi:hypothetical protein MFLAVUS_001022 [Mucor flavus]|uniref:Uncharacterized protein n=1 Tax=Mucor flavus TaxID=439312 RepID=A0ABP9YLB2_9FUNG
MFIQPYMLILRLMVIRKGTTSTRCPQKLSETSVKALYVNVSRGAFIRKSKEDGFGFIENTVRHFLDLIDSPNNPLKEVTGERKACINTIIYIMNQLLIANNDLVALDWIENEFCKIEEANGMRCGGIFGLLLYS